jgi:hypothetical protein
MSNDKESSSVPSGLLPHGAESSLGPSKYLQAVLNRTGVDVSSRGVESSIKNRLTSWMLSHKSAFSLSLLVLAIKYSLTLMI